MSAQFYFNINLQKSYFFQLWYNRFIAISKINWIQFSTFHVGG